MGCWNETCVLTRMPIAAGMPVVVLTQVNGMKYRNNDAMQALLFGMPLIGEYDDYGGVEALRDPAQLAFQKAAFLKSGFYKKFLSDRGSVQVAASADTLWGLTHDMQHFFYAEHGVTPSSLKEYDEESSARRDAAYQAIDQALKTLGEKLSMLSPENLEGSVQDEVFKLVSEVFGPDKAWLAYEYMARNGLYASTSQIFMHQAAYDAMVTEFGARELRYHKENAAFTVREYISNLLDKCVEDYKAQYAKWHATLKLLYPDQATLDKDIQGYIHSREAEVLSPATRPWNASSFPIIGHYWGGATFEEVFEAVPREQIIDYLVFQWAINYTRIEIDKPNCGSQSREVALHLHVMEQLKPVLAEHNLTGKDFMGTVFRPL